MDALDINSDILEYIPVLLFIIISSGIIIFALITSYIIVPQNPYNNKLAPYECGIDTFEDTRKPFDIKFYLVAVLFILFDIEILFMYPWALSFLSMSSYGFVSMLIFIGILTLGFIYEWKKGALKW